MNLTDNGNNYQHNYYLVFHVVRSVFKKKSRILQKNDNASQYNTFVS